MIVPLITFPMTCPKADPTNERHVDVDAFTGAFVSAEERLVDDLAGELRVLPTGFATCPLYGLTADDPWVRKEEELAPVAPREAVGPDLLHPLAAPRKALELALEAV